VRTRSQVTWSFDADVIAAIKDIARRQRLKETEVANTLMHAALGMEIQFPVNERLPYPVIDIPEMQWRGDVLKFQDVDAKFKTIIDYLRENKNAVDLDTNLYTVAADLIAIKAHQNMENGERPSVFMDYAIGLLRSFGGHMRMRELRTEVDNAFSLKNKIWAVQAPPLEVHVQENQRCVREVALFSDVPTLTKTFMQRIGIKLIASPISGPHGNGDDYRISIAFDANDGYREYRGVTSFLHVITFQYVPENGIYRDDDEDEREQFRHQSWLRCRELLTELQKLKSDLVIAWCSTPAEFVEQIEAKGLSDVRAFF
jgi:hypothetical protein